MTRKGYLVRGVVLSLLVVVGLVLSGCTMATVRTLDEDEEAKQGFSGEEYVDDIWESRVLPTYEEQAQDLPTLLTQINADQDAAIEQYGHRSGTGAYSFMVRSEAQVVDFDTSSRAGIMTVDLPPYDGEPDATLTIGPLIKISQRAAVRDAVGFIEYGSFTNQQEFAAVANAMGDLVVTAIADALGAADVEAIRELDPASIEGKTINFTGAYSLDDPDTVLIVPVMLEVTD